MVGGDNVGLYSQAMYLCRIRPGHGGVVSGRWLVCNASVSLLLLYHCSPASLMCPARVIRSPNCRASTPCVKLQTREGLPCTYQNVPVQSCGSLKRTAVKSYKWTLLHVFRPRSLSVTYFGMQLA